MVSAAVRNLSATDHVAAPFFAEVRMQVPARPATDPAAYARDAGRERSGV